MLERFPIQIRHELDFVEVLFAPGEAIPGERNSAARAARRPDIDAPLRVEALVLQTVGDQFLEAVVVQLPGLFSVLFGKARSVQRGPALQSRPGVEIHARRVALAFRGRRLASCLFGGQRRRQGDGDPIGSGPAGGRQRGGRAPPTCTTAGPGTEAFGICSEGDWQPAAASTAGTAISQGVPRNAERRGIAILDVPTRSDAYSCGLRGRTPRRLGLRPDPSQPQSRTRAPPTT